MLISYLESGIEAMSEKLEIPLKDFRKWLEQETRSTLEPLETDAKNLLDNLESRLEDLEAACEKLLEDAEKEIQKGSRKTYRRSRVACKFASNVLDAIDKVAIPVQMSYERLSAFCDDYERISVAIERERARYYPQISPFFIIDRRRVDVALKRAIDSFKELQSFSSTRYEDAKTVEESFSIVDELRDLLGELERMRERKKRVDSRREAAEKKIADASRRSEQIRSTGEVVELDQIKRDIEELRKEVKHSMRYLQKPFLKFRNLVQGPGYPLPLSEAKELGEYLTNPFKALATEEEGYPILKEILRKLQDALAQGKLKLKTARLRKAEKQINDILRKDALTGVQNRCREAYSQKLRLSTSEVIAMSQTNLSKVQDNLRNLQQKKKLHDVRSAALGENIAKTREKIESQRKKMEEIALELTAKDIQLVLS